MSKKNRNNQPKKTTTFAELLAQMQAEEATVETVVEDAVTETISDAPEGIEAVVAEEATVDQPEAIVEETVVGMNEYIVQYRDLVAHQKRNNHMGKRDEFPESRVLDAMNAQELFRQNGLVEMRARIEKLTTRLGQIRSLGFGKSQEQRDEEKAIMVELPELQGILSAPLDVLAREIYTQTKAYNEKYFAVRNAEEAEQRLWDARKAHRAIHPDMWEKMYAVFIGGDDNGTWWRFLGDESFDFVAWHNNQA